MNTNPIIEKAISVCGNQVKLAEKSGLSQAAIHKLLYGKSKTMSVRTALLLEKATGINRFEFLFLPDENNSGTESRF